MTTSQVLIACTLTLVGLLGVAVVLTRDPLRQVMVNGLFGLALVLLFTLLQAPDVAISMAVVSTIAYPAVLLMTIYRVGSRSRE
jgi:energy-converting hydrogenase B subunit D